MKFEA